MSILTHACEVSVLVHIIAVGTSNSEYCLKDTGMLSEERPPYIASEVVIVIS